MKVLVVGAGKPPAIERYFVHHLNALGVETTLLAAQNIFFDYYEKNLWNKLLFRSGLSPIYPDINRIFREKVEALSPDIIWVFKGMELFPESLRWARDRRIKLVNYNTDNPFVFSGKGSGNANVTGSIGLYHLHLTYDPGISARLEREYRLPVRLLPFSFEDDPAVFEECSRQPEELRVCFVGSPDKGRAAFLQELGEAVPLDIYGPLWDKFIGGNKIRLFPPVHEREFWKALYRYRVQLNLMRVHNPDSHNMRSFEVTGMGGIMLAPATPDHATYFLPGEEIFLYSDVQDAIRQARGLLTLSAGEAGAIRRKVRQRSLDSGYSYLGRARQVKAWFEAML
jgi:hypothetical protein